MIHHFGGGRRVRRITIVAAMLGATVSLSSVSAATPGFSSARPLLLKQSALPRHYRYVSSFVDDSVGHWDGGIQQVIAIDSRYGWLEGAQELVHDPGKHEVDISVQLFDTAQGARGDFAQFFTNKHPQTIYIPGAYWLGGIAVKGYGNRATLYREQDLNSACPKHLITGLTFVYGNGIFSVGVCTRTVGDVGAGMLGKRLLARARSIGGR
jgi:hypothetical protein